jgi:hypothetical protein
MRILETMLNGAKQEPSVPEFAAPSTADDPPPDRSRGQDAQPNTQAPVFASADLFD